MTDSNIFWLIVGFSMFSGIMGFYVGERGFQGVQNDLNNVKLDVANIKGKISGPTVTPTVVTPTLGLNVPAANSGIGTITTVA